MARPGGCHDGAAKRMQDVQFISELLLVSIEGTVHGFDQDVLTEKYAEYDSLEDAGLADSGTQVERMVSEVKQCLYEMEKHNHCVSRCAATLQTFYTLWAYLAITDPSKVNAAQVAEKLWAFLDRVDELRKASPEVLSQMLTKGYAEEYKFLENSRGASTDLTPRKNRLEALQEALK
jgi:hypothetical protein